MPDTLQPIIPQGYFMANELEPHVVNLEAVTAATAAKIADLEKKSLTDAQVTRITAAIATLNASIGQS
jgi:hypothetical protein